MIMTTIMVMIMPTDSKHDPVLSLTGVSLTLGSDGDGHRVVARLPDLHVAPGDRLAVTGPSGCGKSTLLNVISGLHRVDEGEVFLCGKSLERMRPAALDAHRGAALGFVHQTFHLLHGFSVLDNVLAGLRFGRAVPARSRRERALNMLEAVGLSHRLHAMPNRLSVGERQRVAIARALAGHPAVLLADEPTGSLDPQSAEGAITLMRALCDRIGCAWICVTHDLSLAAQFPRQISCADAIRHQESPKSIQQSFQEDA